MMMDFANVFREEDTVEESGSDNDTKEKGRHARSRIRTGEPLRE
jgi:hypothetical protein